MPSRIVASSLCSDASTVAALPHRCRISLPGRADTPIDLADRQSLLASGFMQSSASTASALEHGDGSSSASAAAVNRAIEACAKVDADAPVDVRRKRAMARTTVGAHRADAIPHFETPGRFRNQWCASRERACPRGGSVDRQGRERVESRAEGR